mgnify:CR=1 FL=1
MSHPSWVCGLKPVLLAKTESVKRSHPSWVCGLKQILFSIMNVCMGHTLRGCVD